MVMGAKSKLQKEKYKRRKGADCPECGSNENVTDVAMAGNGVVITCRIHGVQIR